MAQQGAAGESKRQSPVCAIITRQTGNDQPQAEQIGNHSRDGKYGHSEFILTK
ncbi:hypothetical protein [Edwardsiella hoshinae]|uniref:hypothetical protein n=1 Tax=Edwardsiella hoshinae TaxID=93378 RepID=UPI001FD7A7C7|nr:hypothetical protein [Edwardsiella hoshinae]